MRGKEVWVMQMIDPKQVENMMKKTGPMPSLVELKAFQYDVVRQIVGLNSLPQDNVQQDVMSTLYQQLGIIRDMMTHVSGKKHQAVSKGS